MKKLIAEISLILTIILAALGCGSDCVNTSFPYQPDPCDLTGDQDPDEAGKDDTVSCGFLRNFDYCTCQCEWVF